MQDRYAGDVGDFGKYGLLNQIYDEFNGNIRLGVNWYYATRQENGNGDGNHIDYLSTKNIGWVSYRECFPKLYDKLKGIVTHNRKISEIENKGVLPDKTIFYSSPIPYSATTSSNRTKDREDWFSASISHLSEADIIFLDPDNGIQLDISKKGHPNAVKYAFTDEIERYYRLGKSLIIYNHRDRRPRAEYDRKFLSNRKYVDSWDDLKVLRFKRVSVRDFVFLIQGHHRNILNRTIRNLTIEPYDFLFHQYLLPEEKAMQQKTKYWTHPSVAALAGDADPIDFMTKKARNVVLHAMEEGWQGPPFDPFKLAGFLSIATVPREGLFDARTLSIGSQRFQIEFNPYKPKGRMRFSVAHELAHTLFPDCSEAIRNRGASTEVREDDWQLELLCNIAAAEFLMPVGSGMSLELEREHITIDSILRLKNEYDVSTEAISLRLANLTTEPCTVFVAARTSDEADADFRVDYAVPSRSSTLNIPAQFEIEGKTVLSECMAVGFTAKGTEQWSTSLPKLDVECTGIPPYPHHRFPRIVGIARTKQIGQPKGLQLKYLHGDALEPRGSGPRIIAHIVNDKTPNWGAGFPLAMKKKWPLVQRDFREWAASDRTHLSLGEVHIIQVSDDITIIHMIAQHGYGPSLKPRVRYEALSNCLIKLATIALGYGSTVHMPRIGAGQAGGNWWIISDLIDQALAKQNIEVTIYDLPNSTSVNYMQGSFSLQSAMQ